MAQTQPTEGGAKGLPWSWTLGVAVGVLAIHVIFSIVMFNSASTQDAGVWDRRLVIYGSIEAIVFTAVGWIFGREVHRADAQAARKDAEEFKAEAKDKGQEAAEQGKAAVMEHERGRALQAAIETAPTPAAAGAAREGAGRSRDVGLGGPTAAAPTPDPAAAQLEALKGLARRLYGDDPGA